MNRLTLLLLFVLASARPAHAQSAAAPALRESTCSVEGLGTALRRSRSSHSAAYRKYLHELAKEAAVTLPAAELQAAFWRERDPALAEDLAAAVVARTERGADPAAIREVARRALEEPDPKLRAAVVRSLRRTSALESTGALYEQLVKDASPEVRAEAATNIVEDVREVYAGFHGPASDAAVSAALASDDPEVTAKILGTLDTQAISADSAGRIGELLRDDAVQVRRAAALALGGVPAEQMAQARQQVLAQYGEEPSLEVRRALLQSLAQLGFIGAIPDLQRLRGVEPRLSEEIDAWVRVLELDLQEWNLILREKERYAQVR
ncbi:HEAT repeat domain-containing protein [Aggregicoccus sp. 17bor-14]|uniref:HEAT repeat domain-containing protein n=1 Tax=Myxococcaceae TaxID=31 RepID=UPI00129C45B1|nr:MULTISPECIES: HEAT repeat domain-containing protein [Myxococcaceae]MBF5044942.1 HEAT repeat domain-containing protein [Simulacricoccus sp. 17bor-14]MRI90685.1 HEAT repeat domain-containing protein [Aggregicoccus sp. 17bor-14]